MKKLLFITLGLAALFGVTACVEPQNVSPTFNPVDNTINTQFYFNISAAAGESDPSTKQADTAVQLNGNFRGIDNATLFAIINPTDLTDQTIKAPAKKMFIPVDSASAMRDMSYILKQEAITSTEGGTRIIEINMPIGTNQLVFYGMAAQQPIDGLDSRELYGGIMPATTNTQEYIFLKDKIGSYALRRLAKEDSSAFTFIQALVDSSFNGLFRTTILPTVDTSWYGRKVADNKIKFEHSGIMEEYEVTSPLYWADYGCSDDNNPNIPAGRGPVSPYFRVNGQGQVVPGNTLGPGVGNPAPATELEKILGKAYTAFSLSQYENDIRAGSGSMAARTLADLYTIVSAVANAIPTSLQERVAQVIAEKMVYSIDRLSEPVTIAGLETRRWKKPEDIKVMLGRSQTIIDTKYSIDNFPEQMHMPAGSVTLGLDHLIEINNPLLLPAVAGGKTRILQIKYTNSLDTLFNGGSAKGNLYTYSPGLLYYGNSSIRTNEDSSPSFPTHAGWNNSTAWDGGNWNSDGSAITNATRGIAMTNTIQYAVALLISQLNVPSATLVDNGAGKPDKEKSITLSSNSYLDWTGILVGGQPEQVGWDYLLNKSSDVQASSNAIVYDKINYRLSEKGTNQDTCGFRVNSQGLQGVTNYTMLYDNVDPYTNYSGTDDEVQGNVYVALEFVNHLGTDFWGEQGLIRDGSTFYLFAKLTPNAGASGDYDAFWNKVFTDTKVNNNHLLPPYNADGTTRHVRRVFVQDVKTNVVFTLGPESLKHAYIAVPDLRSARISLGMNVDLNWSAGLTYSAPLGQR